MIMRAEELVCGGGALGYFCPSPLRCNRDDSAPHPRRRTFRPLLSQVPGTDVGQPGREAEPEGPGLQVQGSRVWRRDLAAAWGDCAGAGGAVGHARRQRTAPAVRACRGGECRRGSRRRGRQRHASLPDLRRRDVGRPRVQAQSASARLQVPQQAARARWSGVRGRDLAGAGRLTEPVPTVGAAPERSAACTRSRRRPSRRPAGLGRTAARRRRPSVLARVRGFATGNDLGRQKCREPEPDRRRRASTSTTSMRAAACSVPASSTRTGGTRGRKTGAALSRRARQAAEARARSYHSVLSRRVVCGEKRERDFSPPIVRFPERGRDL